MEEYLKEKIQSLTADQIYKLTDPRARDYYAYCGQIEEHFKNELLKAFGLKQHPDCKAH